MTGVQTCALPIYNVTGDTTFKLFVADGYEPVVTASNGAAVTLTKKGAGTAINANTSTKWDVTISNITGATSVVVTTKWASKALDGTLVASEDNTTSGQINLSGILVNNPAGLKKDDMTLDITVELWGVGTSTWATFYTENGVKLPTSDAADDADIFGTFHLNNTFPTGTYKVTVAYTIASTGETGTFTSANCIVS